MLTSIFHIVIGILVGISFAALLSINDADAWHSPQAKWWICYFFVTVVLSGFSLLI